MAEDERTGEVENVSFETKHIEWRIPGFFPDSNHEYTLKSPNFTFKDITCYFRLHGSQNSEHIEIDIYREEHYGYIFEYCFALKSCDGTVEDVVIGTVKKTARFSKWERLITKTKLLQRKTELLPFNILTITCTLKMVTAVSPSVEPTTMFEHTKPLKLTKLDKLSKNFKDFLADQEFCDVTLKVKDKEYMAHKSVLIARSPVFAANFKHDTLERQTGVITIPDCDPNSFQAFLEYLYCGELEQLSFQNALNLYYISDKYELAELKAFCVECIMQCITVENVCEIVILANKHDEAELLSAVQTFFNQNVSKILITPEWECLLKNDYRLANKLMINMSKVKLTE